LSKEKDWSLKIETDLGLRWSGPQISLNSTSGLEMAEVEFGEVWEHVNRTEVDPQNQVPDADTMINDTFISGGVTLERQVAFDREDLSKFSIRLVVKNTTDGEISLRRGLPIVVDEPANLKLGKSKASKWGVLRQARYKNDLPSTCVLGRVDSRYLDALKGLTESGEKTEPDEGDVPLGVVSDSLTVLKSDEGRGEAGLLIGFLTEASQLVECRIFLDSARQDLDRLEVATLMDGISLKPGEHKTGEWLRVDGDADMFGAIERFAKLKARIAGTSPLPNPPSVYFTWYYYGMTVHEKDLEENLAALEEQRIPFDVFQIDAGWARAWGDWEPNHKFPSGMEAVAERIKASGYRPGIWTCPFIIEPRCEIRFYHPDWLLKTRSGEPVKFAMMEANHFVLDVSHPEVLEWLEKLYRKMTEEWGFTYHKLDFTRATAINRDAVYFAGVTRAEAYRMGIEAVRRGAGPDSYILNCGGLYGASLGLVNGQRTGSDVRGWWPEKTEDSDEPIAPLTIKQNSLRFWMNNIYHNDPDAFIARRRSEEFRGVFFSLGLFTDEEVKILTLNEYFAGGQIGLTEPIAEIDKDRLGLFRHVVPSMGTSAVPRDMFSGGRYPSVFDVEVHPAAPELDRWHTVALVNWRDEPVEKTFVLDGDAVGGFSREHDSFSASEFWSGRIWEDLSHGDSIDLGQVPAHSAVLLRISPLLKDAPSLLYTNGHFTMGGAEIRSWMYAEGSLTFKIDWQWDFPLELVIKPREGKKWRIPDIQGDVQLIDETMIRLRLPGRFSGDIEIVED
jgi:hypothetical protein